MREAKGVLHELKRTWEGKERSQAVLRGLRRMLESSLQTISPRRLREKWGTEYWDYFSCAKRSIESLVSIAAEVMGVELRKRNPEASRVEEVLGWEKAVRMLGRERLEALGFLWFADEKLLQLGSIGRRVVMRESLSMVGKYKLADLDGILEEAEVECIGFPW